MFCPKCGTNNEENNVFCKNCGAKLEHAAASNHYANSQSTVGAAKTEPARKPMNAALIIGIVAAIVVVVGLIVVAVVISKINSNKPLFEQIEIGKTTAADVEKYFDKNHLSYERDVTAISYEEYPFDIMGHNFGLILKYDEYIEFDNDIDKYVDYVNTNTLRSSISDTLWGADCEYFISVSGKEEDNDNKRDVLYTSCVVTLDGKDEEKAFRQHLNEYIKKKQKTELKNQSYSDSGEAYLGRYDSQLNATNYPLNVKKWNDEKILTCLCYNDAFLERDGIILITLYAEKYYSDKELNNIMKKNLMRNTQEEIFTKYDGIERTVHTGIYIAYLGYKAEKWEIGYYYFYLLNSMYLDFEKSELETIEKEVPNLVYSFSETRKDKELIKGLSVDGYRQGLTGDVIIPETIHEYPVSYIAENAFENCTKITNIKISDGITNIGSDAFSGCSSLIDVTLPSGITEIWGGLFADCSSLTDVEIPDTVTYIGSSAFANCSSLIDITIPDGITEIKEGTFSGCTSLTNITIPDGVTTIGSKAFANCNSLTGINIPSSVTEIADDAFDGCDNLVSDDLKARFPNAVPKPAWLEAYRAYMNGNDSEMYFIGTDSKSVPYLVMYYNGLYHYNGTEVERLQDVRELEYNPKTNKALIFEAAFFSDWENYEFYSLEDLFTATEEMSINSYENSENGNITYHVNEVEVSKEEYDRAWNEMESQFGEGGYWVEDYYSSVDEAYQAYIANKDNISTTDSSASSSGGASAQEESASEYILKDSASRYLTQDDLQGFSADDCRLARNEIYARHGRKFDDEGLQSHFDACSWYHGTIEAKDFDETMLTEIEIANKDLIVEYEKEMGYR